MWPGSSTVIIGFGMLMALQFLFGMGEAGAFPNIARALYNWFPAKQRGFAQGAIWLSARLMGGLTPFVWVLLVTIIGLTWREAVWLFAGVALVWCGIFFLWFRNRPDEHSYTNQAERDLIAERKQLPAGHAGVPWKRIFTSRNVWALCLMYMVTNFNWYFLMYNLPGVLKAEFKDWGSTDGGKLMLALLSGAPLLIGMFGCLLGGLLTDRYIRRTGNRKWGRRVFAMFGYGMAGLCYLTATAFTDSLWPYAICLMLVGFFNDFIMGPSWAAAQDIGRRYSAIVSGMMNMVGNTGAFLGIFVTGRIVKAHTVNGVTDVKAYIILFTLYAIIYFAGVLAWLNIDASKPIVTDDEEAHA
jgi:nitrate/nitrite transporter NarK